MDQDGPLSGFGLCIFKVTVTCNLYLDSLQLLVMQGLPNRTVEDDKAIEVLLQGIKGEEERERQRGTFLTYLAAMGHREDDGILQCYKILFMD
jgi:hypothetical protein